MNNIEATVNTCTNVFHNNKGPIRWDIPIANITVYC